MNIGDPRILPGSFFYVPSKFEYGERGRLHFQACIKNWNATPAVLRGPNSSQVSNVEFDKAFVLPFAPVILGKNFDQPPGQFL